MPGDKGSYFAVFGEEPVAASQPTEVEAPVSASQPAQQQKLVPRTAEAQGLTDGRNVIDVAELGGWGNALNRRRLRERGFSYQDATTGDIINVAANSLSRRDMRKLANKAAREETLARRFGIGDTTGWSQDAINLRRQQVGNDSRYTTLNAPAATQETAQEPQKNYEFAFGNFFEGDNAYYKPITQGILNALYENGKYDLLDSMVGPDGKIGLGGLQRFHKGLNVEGANYGYFDEASINALLNSGAITQAQATQLINGLPLKAPETPAAAATTPRPATDWVQAAKAAGFGVGLDEAASNYNDLILGRVASWQKANGLTNDGKFGNLSRARLGSGTFAANSFDSNGNYIGAQAMPQAASNGAYSVTAGHYDGNFPNEWRMAGLKPGDVNYVVTKPGGLFTKGSGYWDLTPELAAKINSHYTQSRRRGGKLMKYFQQGGSIAAQQVAQEQAQQQEAQLNEMFMALAKNPKETLMALQKQGVQPKQVIELAQKMADKNPAAKQALAALSQMSQMAKEGAKLQYIKRLRGECPEGYEAKTYKIGGKICKKCEKIEAEKCGGKAKKHENGGEAELVTEFKNRKKK